MSKRTLSMAVILILAVSATFYCSKGDGKEKRKKITAAPQQEAKPRPLVPVITKVLIKPPEPTSVDFLQAEPELEYKRMKYVTYSYRWYVNGAAVRGIDRNGLPSSYFKRGDVVYCLVKAKRSIYQSEEVESKKVEIGNAPPVINSSPVESFQAPGIFRYTIDARDPDGDSLSYRLLSPLKKGITVDPITGQIQWHIAWSPPLEEEESPESPGFQQHIESSGESSQQKRAQKDELDDFSPIVNILFEVKDSEGAATAGSIMLNLSEGKEIFK